MSDELEALAAALRERLVREAGAGEDADLHARIRALVDRDAGLLDPIAREDLVGRVIERSFGLGALEPLLRDLSVDEVMVNGPGTVFVERAGRIEPAGVRFETEADLRHAIERILAPLGRRVDEAEPLVDARLPDGSRVNVIIPPLAVDGPVVTIRRFRRAGFTPDDLVAAGTWSAPLRELLAAAVRARLNVLVSGGTGSGKTTTLNALSSFVPDGERIVTVEDAAELRLQQAHVVRLEARPASLEGRGEVSVRRLVRNALRMRPDRIIVGEVRGPEESSAGLHPSGHQRATDEIAAFRLACRESCLLRRRGRTREEGRIPPSARLPGDASAVARNDEIAPRGEPVARRRHEAFLSDDVADGLSALGRPYRTGARRSIPKKFFIAAYVRAVDDLLGNGWDTHGLDVRDEDACVERVKSELSRVFAVSALGFDPETVCVGCRPEERLFHESCPVHGPRGGTFVEGPSGS